MNTQNLKVGEIGQINNIFSPLENHKILKLSNNKFLNLTTNETYKDTFTEQIKIVGKIIYN
jgi:hypothetical protein